MAYFMSKIKVQDKPNLVRDSETGAILNLNNEEREHFIRQRTIRRKKEEQTRQAINRIDLIDERVTAIESKLDLILTLLQRS